MFSGQSRLTPASGILSTDKQTHKLAQLLKKPGYWSYILPGCNLKMGKSISHSKQSNKKKLCLSQTTPREISHALVMMSHTFQSADAPLSVLVSLQAHT